MRLPAVAIASSLIALLVLAPATANAADEDQRAAAPDTAPRPRGPFRFGAARDIPILTLSAVSTSAWFFNHGGPACAPDCTLGRTNFVDDALGPARSSRTASDLADVGLAAILVLPHVVNAARTWPRNEIWTEDFVLTLESAFLAQGISQVVKLFVAREAPVVFDENADDERKSTPDSNKSFWSAHTAAAVAAATSFSIAYWLRHPNDPWRWVVFVGLETAALAIGGLTMLGGDHYPTDVLAGAAFGAAMGVTVPFVHATPELGGVKR